MNSLAYMPPMIIGDDAGFRTEFIVGWAPWRKARSTAAPSMRQAGRHLYRQRVFKARTGRDLDDTTARGMQGFLALVDAIDRAGSTEPEKQFQKALLGDRPVAAGAADDRLSRRAFRRHRPERRGRDVPDPAPGQGIQVGVAGGSRHQQARMADEGLALTQKIMRN